MDAYGQHVERWRRHGAARAAGRGSGAVDVLREERGAAAHWEALLGGLGGASAHLLMPVDEINTHRIHST